MKQLVKKLMPVWMRRELRRVFYRYRLAKYRSRSVEKSVFGEKLHIWIGDPIAERWYNHDILILPSFEIIEKKITGKDATIFYIGAHYSNPLQVVEF
jgi:hypothetical protein